uniref:Uncharacterized protein n=1 Tax=Arundo donax TaxID=35708 RepID=A0A0A9C944_ARUDO
MTTPDNSTSDIILLRRVVV